MNIESLLKQFLLLVQDNRVEIYNEFSLQHELGIFLRERAEGYKVQFERNTKFFGIKGTVKHEIDIVIYNDTEKYAIELKYPLNGQHPEQMFSFVKDIRFMEELKESGFDGTYCLTIVEDSKFYAGDKKDGIYTYFRSDTPIHGKITKPTGKKDDEVTVNGCYITTWKPCGDKMYYLIKL